MLELRGIYCNWLVLFLDNPSLPLLCRRFLTQRYDTTNAKILGKPIYTKDKLESLSIEELDVEGFFIIKENLTRDEMNMWLIYFGKKDY